MTPTAALTQLLAERSSEGTTCAKPIRPLHLGPLAHSWLVEYGDERAVLRIDQPAAAAMGLDRATEFSRLTAVAAAGLGPPPIAADVAHGLLLRRHIEGGAWQAADLRSPANLQRVAALLRRVHVAQIVAPPLYLDAAIERYVRLAGSGATALGEATQSLLAGCRDPQAPLVFCHNDPVAGNFLSGPGPADTLWLIDWEYSGFNEFWFDLAVIHGHHDLPESLAQSFLDAYFQRPATAMEFEKLAAWVAFYRSLVSLWQSALPAPP